MSVSHVARAPLPVAPDGVAGIDIDLVTDQLDGRKRVAPSWPLCGVGRSRGHHGEILQGAFEIDGRLHRGLATLPSNSFGTIARIELRRDDPQIVVSPPWRTRSLRAARSTLDVLGLDAIGGVLRVESDVRVGCGFGTSSADVTASIKAVLDATGSAMSRATIASVAVGAEVASDPLMFDHALLFAQREGRVLEDFRASLPPMVVVGCHAFDVPVDTLAFPAARYDDREIASFRPLLGRLRRGLATGCSADIGRVATASARINQRFLPIPQFDRFTDLAKELGALGVQVAHSGNLLGVLLDAEEPLVQHRVEAVRKGLEECGVASSWAFTTGSGTGGVS